MSGTGKAPKDPSQRRNRHAPARGEWLELEPLKAPLLGDLPALRDEEWRPSTAATWEAWRNDPVTQTWSPADFAYAADTILLHQAMSASSANEVRLRMDGLGLTPKGKRDLRLRIADVSVEAPKRKAQVRRLRIVADDESGKLLAS